MIEPHKPKSHVTAARRHDIGLVLQLNNHRQYSGYMPATYLLMYYV